LQDKAYNTVSVFSVFVLPAVSKLSSRERRRRVRLSVKVWHSRQRIPVLVQSADYVASYPASSLLSSPRHQRRRRLSSRPHSVRCAAGLRREAS